MYIYIYIHTHIHTYMNTSGAARSSSPEAPATIGSEAGPASPMPKSFRARSRKR